MRSWLLCGLRSCTFVHGDKTKPVKRKSATRVTPYCMQTWTVFSGTLRDLFSKRLYINHIPFPSLKSSELMKLHCGGTVNAQKMAPASTSAWKTSAENRLTCLFYLIIFEMFICMCQKHGITSSADITDKWKYIWYLLDLLLFPFNITVSWILGSIRPLIPTLHLSVLFNDFPLTTDSICGAHLTIKTLFWQLLFT